ncbi:MAG: AAC(3) family N-acetyltransferase [Elusimicrobiota bacterium]
MPPSINKFAHWLLPNKGVESLRKIKRWVAHVKRDLSPKLDADTFLNILKGPLALKKGDTVFIHSAAAKLNLSFPLEHVFPLIFDIIGPQGTVLVPAYPKLPSHEYVKTDPLFDVNSDRSYMGALTEILRTDPRTKRSLHPTKSVCAQGALADEFTRDHHTDILPYGRQSPYYRAIEAKAVAIGLGVNPKYLSLVHSVDDTMGKDYPVDPYLPEAFRIRCLDWQGRDCQVETLVHDPAKMLHDVPAFLSRCVNPDIYLMTEIAGREFFRIDTAALFTEMVRLAKQGETIYPPSIYRMRAP